MTYIANQSSKASAKSQAKEILRCPCCGTELKNLNSQTYTSKSRLWSYFGRLLICKSCVDSIWEEFLERYNYDVEKAMYYICMTFDYAFHKKLLESSKKTVEEKGGKVIQKYLTVLNSFGEKNGYADCFKNGEKLEINIIEEKVEQNKHKKIVLTDEDKKNKEDIKNLLGYDPFENELDEDKKFLYAKLIDFLDEATLEDSFKIPVVCEIVKGFNHAEKINQAIANIDITKIEKVKDIKDLVATKTQILSSILAMAKDNGISVNHSNNKSKGSGTLSGIIKKLNELDLEDIKVNLFNIETAEAIKQVADISNRSILDQLRFDENDYTEIIREQKKMIESMDEKLIKLEEENRILKYNKIKGGE